jgi:hypothetical protein
MRCAKNSGIDLGALVERFRCRRVILWVQPSPKPACIRATFTEHVPQIPPGHRLTAKLCEAAGAAVGDGGRISRAIRPRPRRFLVLCVGSSHVLSEARPPQHTINALHALRRLVSPGGRVLLGEGFWEYPPSPERIAAMWPGITAEDHYDLAGLTSLAVSAGFRPEWIETATLEEWEDFESGVGADVEEWLARHQDHPQAAETRKKADGRLSIWLRGSRACLGMAYLTLIPLP